MNPPSIPVPARTQSSHVPDQTSTAREEAGPEGGVRSDAVRFGRKPYSPPTLELLVD